MKYAGVAQLVEHQPSKLRVEGSSLFARSVFISRCSSGVEHFHGKEGVKGSNPFIGSAAKPRSKYNHKDSVFS